MSHDSLSGEEKNERGFTGESPDSIRAQHRHVSQEKGSSSPFSRIEAYERILKKADNELVENLKLFVERLVLYRITRVKEKAPELAAFARFLLEAGTLDKEGENDGPPKTATPSAEISSIEGLRNEKLSTSDIAGLFSAMVDALENLNGRQLYYILEKLRTEPMARH